MIHVFIIGSKGIPARYGGFETFVENLTARKNNKNIYYHVSCMDNDEKHFEYNGADCFNVRLPMKGAKGRILHVSRVLSKIEQWKINHKDAKAVVYILGCRIGPLLFFHAKVIRNMGIKILVNPDGMEWKRAKWNKFERIFLKFCERCLVINADDVICDSLYIEKYIQQMYPHMKKKTTYIPYGADVTPSTCSKKDIENWLSENQIESHNYYLIVGRFVPENNYETMITEFMRSYTNKKLVIITNVKKNSYYYYLKRKTGFDNDSRIKFVGTVYDTELLKGIRENAFAYLHGHEVGGTNPSLLEALATTRRNLLLDVKYNREVAGEGALYWEKGKLLSKLNMLEEMDINDYEKIFEKGLSRIMNAYSWEKICEDYEQLFINK